MGKKKEYILYGLDNFEKILNETSDFLKGVLDEFDLRLILSEALSNAFIHGNKKDSSKPIFLRLKLFSTQIIFEIEDTGMSTQEFEIPEEISEENILSDNGRGLFLLKCFTDDIDFKNNILFLNKNLQLTCKE